ALLARLRLPGRVPYDHRRRPLVDDRCGGAVSLRVRFGARIRVLPRAVDRARPDPGVLLHVAVRVRARASPRARADGRDRDRSRARRSGGERVTVTAPPPPEVDDIPGVTRRHRPSDLYHERTNFQFIKHSRRWLIISSTL